MKDIIFTIVKYIIFTILLLVLLGYLSIKEKLPALFSDEIASQMKEYSLVIVQTITGQTKQPMEEVETVVNYHKRSVGYEIIDFLFLNNRYHQIKKQSMIHSEKIKEWAHSYQMILSSLGASSEYQNFVRQPNSESRRYEIKSFIDKLLTEEQSLIGVEIYDSSIKKLLNLSKSPIVPLQKVDSLHDNVTLLTKYYENQAQLSMILKENKTYLRFVYAPSIFQFLTTSNKIENFFLILDDRNELVYFSTTQYTPYTIDELKTQLLEKKFPFSLKFHKTAYGIVYSTIFDNFTVVYLYPKTPIVQILLNIFLYLLILFFLFVLILLFNHLYKNVYQKMKQKKIDKEELLTGLMSEMTHTLKSTAELTEKVVEESKSNIEIVNKTIDKIKSLPEEETILQTEQEWKILED